MNLYKSELPTIESNRIESKPKDEVMTVKLVANDANVVLYYKCTTNDSIPILPVTSSNAYIHQSINQSMLQQYRRVEAVQLLQYTIVHIEVVVLEVQ